MARVSRRVMLKEWIYYDPDFDQVRSPSHCAIANRIAESDPDIRRVEVQRESIRFTYASTRMRMEFRTPPDARRFLNAFDQGKRPRGFMLILRASDLVAEWSIGMVPWGRVVIEHDGRGSGPRGPRLRPLPA